MSNTTRRDQRTGFRSLPSIDALLRRETIQGLIRVAGHDAVRNVLRLVLADVRREIRSSTLGGEGVALNPLPLIEERVANALDRKADSLMQRVINATGVVIHTNLGRARLSQAALDAITTVATSYSNLEYDLMTGERGKRGSALEAMLSEIFSCEAAAIVNNCAAAVLIVLNTLADGGEVIVSRGELIEIGGSFRIPDVIAKSGARLVEVGTTNRTRLSDYQKAISPETRLVLRAHPSNYRIVGFTETASLAELSRLARENGLPLFEDLGSGCVTDLSDCGVGGEPTVAASLRSGVSLLAFSGDKLFGGPQAGIILGEARLIDLIKTNPMVRALRVDKLTLAALEATASSYARGQANEELPVLASLRLSLSELTHRARGFVRRAHQHSPELDLTVIDGFSVVGGGAAPEAKLPTALIRFGCGETPVNEMEARLRRNRPPVIARVVDDQLVLDLRTVTAQEEKEIIAALSTCTSA